jgi:hypothetical protein
MSRDAPASPSVLREPLSSAVVARTDAENDYLQRADNKGILIVDPAIYARFGLNAQLYNGRLTIFLDPVPGAVKVGDKITLKVGLQDPSMAQPVQDRTTVKIVEETVPPKPPKKTKTKSRTSVGDGGNKEGERKPAPPHGLPRKAAEDTVGRMSSAGTTSSVRFDHRCANCKIT